MSEHRIKCDADVFAEMVAGRKRFEYRKNDRDYQTGDTLEVVCNTSGQALRLGVSFVLYPPSYGVPDGYCVMSVFPLDTCAPPPDAQLTDATARAEKAEARNQRLDEAIEQLAQYTGHNTIMAVADARNQEDISAVTDEVVAAFQAARKDTP
jgi:hypothetical protein